MSYEPAFPQTRSDSEVRLALVGRLALRISENPAPRELCLFVYNLLSEYMSVDSLYIAAATRQTEALQGILVMDGDIEFPAERLKIDDQDVVFGPGPMLLDDRDGAIALPFGNDRPARSAIVCAMRFSGRVVGQLCVASHTARAFSEDDLQLVQIVADHLGTSFERDQMRREFEVREAELQAILERDRQFSSSLAVDMSLRELARGLLRVSGADAVIVSAIDQDTNLYTPAAYHAAQDISLEGLLDPIPPEITTAILGAMAGPALAIGDTEDDRVSRWERVTSSGWQVQITLPLMLGDRHFGFIELGSKREGFSFTSSLVELCRILIEQAAIGIHQTQLSERAVQRSTALSGLAEFSETMNNAPDDLKSLLSSICNEANRLLHTSHTSLFLLNSAEQRLELEAQSGIPGALNIGAHISVDYPFSLVARAVRERRLIVEVDLRRDGGHESTAPNYVPFDVGRAKCAIVAPLRHNGATLGVLLLTDRRRRKVFHSDEIGLVTDMAAHASAALARSQLRAAEQERFHITSALGRISASIGTEDRPSTIYAQILREAASLIAYDEASIGVIEDSEIRVAAAIGPALSRLPRTSMTVSLWREPDTLNLATCMRDPALAKILGGARFADLLSYPMFVNGTIVGRLTFATRRSGLYDAHQVQLAALLAERSAQVVSTVQLRAAQREALVKLTQLDDMRQDFIATVSHELRTPLTGILGYLELLLSRWSSLDDPRRREMIERTQSSATRLEHLVNDLLLFSSVEHEGLQLQIASYSIETLVDQACEVMRTKYRGQDLDIRRGESVVRVTADAQRTIQVIANLLDNAIKYSSIGSRVHVRWMAHRHDVEVTVRDHGPGINEADTTRLFTRFGTLGHQPRPGQVGTGIGLYVSKKMIEAMNGRIWLTSRPGYGSTFHFTLPRAHE